MTTRAAFERSERATLTVVLDERRDHGEQRSEPSCAARRYRIELMAFASG